MDQDQQITRADIEQLKGPVVIEFGATWCGYCQVAQSMIAGALVSFPNVQHIKIEDGKGQRLGRTYSVKLWPTLLFLNDGIEAGRLVRPTYIETITDALGEINISHPSLKLG